VVVTAAGIEMLVAVAEFGKKDVIGFVAGAAAADTLVAAATCIDTLAVAVADDKMFVVVAEGTRLQTVVAVGTPVAAAAAAVVAAVVAAAAAVGNPQVAVASESQSLFLALSQSPLYCPLLHSI